MSTEKATFGAGCFWGVEAAFAAIPGVTATAVGYEGGKLDRPTYKDVCTDTTGHAEVVELDFDPEKVSYEKLLDAFFELHDPTTLNRQGPDWGAQYRSAIFFHSPEQEAEAKASLAKLDEPNETPWLAFGGIVAPDLGLFSITGSTLTSVEPKGPSQLESFPFLPADLQK